MNNCILNNCKMKSSVFFRSIAEDTGSGLTQLKLIQLLFENHPANQLHSCKGKFNYIGLEGLSYHIRLQAVHLQILSLLLLIKCVIRFRMSKWSTMTYLDLVTLKLSTKIENKCNNFVLEFLDKTNLQMCNPCIINKCIHMKSIAAYLLVEKIAYLYQYPCNLDAPLNLKWRTDFIARIVDLENELNKKRIFLFYTLTRHSKHYEWVIVLLMALMLYAPLENLKYYLGLLIVGDISLRVLVTLGHVLLRLHFKHLLGKWKGLLLIMEEVGRKQQVGKTYDGKYKKMKKWLIKVNKMYQYSHNTLPSNRYSINLLKYILLYTILRYAVEWIDFVEIICKVG